MAAQNPTCRLQPASMTPAPAPAAAAATATAAAGLARPPADDRRKSALVVAACAAAVAGLALWARSYQRQQRRLQRKQLTRLRFDLSVGEIEAETAAVLALMQRADDEIAALANPQASYAATAQRLVDLSVDVMSRVSNVTFLGQVAPSKDIRDACTKADEAIEDFSVKSGMRADVYKVFKHLRQSKEFAVRARSLARWSTAE